MSDGKGCECAARSSSDCACPDVDWTPQEVYDLRAELSALKERVSGWVDITKERDLEEQVSALKQMVDAQAVEIEVFKRNEEWVCESCRIIYPRCPKPKSFDLTCEKCSKGLTMPRHLFEKLEIRNELARSREREGVMRTANETLQQIIKHWHGVNHRGLFKDCIMHTCQSAKEALSQDEGKEKA